MWLSEHLPDEAAGGSDGEIAFYFILYAVYSFFGGRGWVLFKMRFFSKNVYYYYENVYFKKNSSQRSTLIL